MEPAMCESYAPPQDPNRFCPSLVPTVVITVFRMEAATKDPSMRTKLMELRSKVLAK